LSTLNGSLSRADIPPMSRNTQRVRTQKARLTTKPGFVPINYATEVPAKHPDPGDMRRKKLRQSALITKQ
jgi:hypothetical protein